MTITLDRPTNTFIKETYELIEKLYDDGKCQFWKVVRLRDGKKFDRWIKTSELKGEGINQ